MLETEDTKERVIKVKTVNQDNLINVKFATSYQYSRAFLTLMEKKPKDKELVSIDNADYKLDLTADSIIFFYYPSESVPWYDGEMRDITVVFEDKQKVIIRILGIKRAKNAYNMLKILMEKDPTNFFVNLPQDEYKYALIKHYSKIKEIYLTESVKEKESING